MIHLWCLLSSCLMHESFSYYSLWWIGIKKVAFVRNGTRVNKCWQYLYLWMDNSVNFIFYSLSWFFSLFLPFTRSLSLSRQEWPYGSHYARRSSCRKHSSSASSSFFLHSSFSPSFSLSSSFIFHLFSLSSFPSFAEFVCWGHVIIGHMWSAHCQAIRLRCKNITVLGTLFTCCPMATVQYL